MRGAASVEDAVGILDSRDEGAVFTVEAEGVAFVETGFLKRDVEAAGEAVFALLGQGKGVLGGGRSFERTAVVLFDVAEGRFELRRGVASGLGLLSGVGGDAAHAVRQSIGGPKPIPKGLAVVLQKADGLGIHSSCVRVGPDLRRSFESQGRQALVQDPVVVGPVRLRRL